MEYTSKYTIVVIVWRGFEKWKEETILPCWYKKQNLFETHCESSSNAMVVEQVFGNF